jgi:hypothetical protein
MSDEPARIDASVITQPLDAAFIALGNKIEREWPQQLSNILEAREVIL